LGSNLARLLVERGLDVTILARPASDHPLLSGLKLSRVEGGITDYTSVLRGMKGSSTFYGPGDVKLHTGEVFRNIASGLLKIAPPGGNGVISIRDCAEGLVAAMEKGRRGERYILNSENLTILEIFNVLAGVLEKPPIRKRFPRWTYPPFYAAAFLVENVFRVFGKASKIECGTIAMSWRFRYFDSSKARRELGWSPRLTFEETCRQALEFYRRQGLLP